MPAAKENDVITIGNTTLIALRNGSEKLVATAAVDSNCWQKIKHISWSLSSGGYAKGFVKGYKGLHKFVSLHQIVMGQPPTSYEIDHINRNKLDCRRSNLRFTTRTENHLNRSIYTKSLSGRTGIFKKGDKFEIYFNYKGEKKYLGRYNSIEEAAVAREEAYKKEIKRKEVKQTGTVE